LFENSAIHVMFAQYHHNSTVPKLDVIQPTLNADVCRGKTSSVETVFSTATFHGNSFQQFFVVGQNHVT